MFGESGREWFMPGTSIGEEQLGEASATGSLGCLDLQWESVTEPGYPLEHSISTCERKVSYECRNG
jgi:hypothetical protein